MSALQMSSRFSHKLSNRSGQFRTHGEIKTNERLAFQHLIDSIHSDTLAFHS